MTWHHYKLGVLHLLPLFPFILESSVVICGFSSLLLGMLSPILYSLLLHLPFHINNALLSFLFPIFPPFFILVFGCREKAGKFDPKKKKKRDWNFIIHFINVCGFGFREVRPSQLHQKTIVVEEICNFLRYFLGNQNGWIPRYAKFPIPFGSVWIPEIP